MRNQPPRLLTRARLDHRDRLVVFAEHKHDKAPPHRARIARKNREPRPVAPGEPRQKPDERIAGADLQRVRSGRNRRAQPEGRAQCGFCNPRHAALRRIQAQRAGRESALVRQDEKCRAVFAENTEPHFSIGTARLEQFPPLDLSHFGHELRPPFAARREKKQNLARGMQRDFFRRFPRCKQHAARIPSRERPECCAL